MNALDVAYAAGAVLLSPVWARKARGGWRERFGHVPALPEKTPGRPRLLVHAVSVGEVNALRALVPLLARGAEVVVSAGTDTGLARARALFGPGPGPGGHGDGGGGAAAAAHVVRYPLDFSACVTRFLDAVRPDAVGLVELEVWPNFIAACARRGIGVGVINGRLSARSFRGYRRLRRVLAPTFSRLAFADVQDEAYAQRFAALGVEPPRVRVTGSMKWDSARLDDDVPGDATHLGSRGLAAVLGIDQGRPLVVAGSTGPGEEALLHAACPAEVQLLCAPRKPERWAEARAALPGCTARWIGAGGTVLTAPGAPGSGRFLLATIGELRAAYALADVVVVGRSFGRQHGSDPIEPVGLGRATLMGPRYGDFETIVHALRDAGGLRIVEAGELRGALERLLGDPALRGAMAAAGRACILAHRGATARHAQSLLQLASRRAAAG